MSGTPVRELITSIGFQLNDNQLKQADAAFRKLTRLAVGIGAALGAKKLYDAFSDNIERAAALGLTIERTAARFGLATNEVQEMGYAASMTGVSATQLAQNLKFMQRNAVLAARGNKQLAAEFGRLGVSITGSNGRILSAPDLLSRVADGIAQIKDPARRTEAAMRLFGRTGSEMLPLLMLGGKGIDALRARAEALGIVLSEGDVKALAGLRRSLIEVKLSLEGVWNRIVARMVPGLQRLIFEAERWIMTVRAFTSGTDHLGHVFDWVVDKASRFAEFMMIHLRYIGILAGVAIPALVGALFTLAGGWIAGFAIPLALGAAFIAFVAIVAAVAEDIYAFVTGQESLLGNLYEALIKRGVKPEDTWFYKAFYAIVTISAKAIKALDKLFGTYFEWLSFFDKAVPNASLPNRLMMAAMGVGRQIVTGETAPTTKSLGEDAWWAKKKEQYNQQSRIADAYTGALIRSGDLTISPAYNINITGTDSSTVAGELRPVLDKHTADLSQILQQVHTQVQQ
jgi:hypothetical protein